MIVNNQGFPTVVLLFDHVKVKSIVILNLCYHCWEEIPFWGWRSAELEVGLLNGWLREFYKVLLGREDGENKELVWFVMPSERLKTKNMMFLWFLPFWIFLVAFVVFKCFFSSFSLKSVIPAGNFEVVSSLYMSCLKSGQTELSQPVMCLTFGATISSKAFFRGGRGEILKV